MAWCSGTALACAAWLALLRECGTTLRARSPQHANAFESRWIRIAAHTGFAWGVLALDPPTAVTPDPFLIAVVMFAATLLLKVVQTGRRSLVLGAVLGAGYLVKFIAFPLAAVMLAILLVARRPLDSRAAGRMIAGFAILAAPWIALLSAHSGRLNAGDAGRLNYGWYVSQVGSQTPRVDARRGENQWAEIAADPAIFAYDSAAFGTYPPWSDPARWGPAGRSRIDISLQLVALKREARHAILILAPLLATLGALALVLAVIAGPASNSAGALWPLGVIGCAGVCAYALVRVDGRLMAPFAPLLTCALLARVAMLPSEVRSRRIALITACAIFALVIAIPIGGIAILEAAGMRSPGDETPIPMSIADELAKAGAPPATRVAVLGSARQLASLARRARLEIVAEAPAESLGDFSLLTAERRDCALNAFHRAGARAVISGSGPADAPSAAWAPTPAQFSLIAIPSRPACAEHAEDATRAPR
jgi:hypothetical protein